MSENRKNTMLSSFRKSKNTSESESKQKKTFRIKLDTTTDSENNPQSNLDESICDNFISLLTISKFKEFVENLKIKEIENIKHDMHLKKSQFIQIMKCSFVSNDERFIKLYEKIFERFKVLKAEVNHNCKIDGNYFINRIYSEEEIDIYEISCALACFIKCYFSEKLKLLFDLTDIDDDGFINEYEVKKLIYTLNLLFHEESNPSGIDSTILTQSLASIKAKKSFNLIMKYPGNLSEIIQEQKYITFEQFLSSVQKVYHYKFNLIPLFVSFKKVLSTVRGEKEIDIKYERFGEYGKISNDIISEIKKEGEYGTSIFDFKKNLVLIKKANKAFSTRVKTQTIHKTKTLRHQNKNSSKKKNLFILPTMVSPFAQKDKLYDIYHINYNRIGGLETYPGKFNVLFTETKNFPTNKKLYLGKSIIENKKNNTGYMTYKEILDEIISLSNKHKISEGGREELLRIDKDVNENAQLAIEKLRGSGIPIKLGTYILKMPEKKKSKTINKVIVHTEENDE